MSGCNVRRESLIEEGYDYFGRTTIVSDNGSAFVKVVIVDGPEIVVPNVVGIRSGTLSKSVSHNVVYVVGEEARAHHGFTIIQSIQHGRIRNFEAMKRVWEHVFYEKLQIDPEECALIITKPALRFEGESERMVSEMFNEFRFKSLLLVVAPLLTMFGNVHTDG
ncbi:hypothetical protein L6452_40219 [Arctium lappa]|uniref:Uncharacterized protein n=1 Tax=Arctium lappa TaxID=4217 RepID=A0ACB8XKR2_ARCLA|nr:hypothetical protein L6452_40219 [Arctium lappa]